jgi:hypothetical protein
VNTQDFGKPNVQQINVQNVLVHDLEQWAKRILDRAERKVGHLYPPGGDGRAVMTLPVGANSSLFKSYMRGRDPTYQKPPTSQR